MIRVVRVRKEKIKNVFTVLSTGLRQNSNVILLLHSSFQFSYFCFALLDMNLRVNFFVSAWFTLFIEILLFSLIVLTLLMRKTAKAEVSLVFIVWSLFLMLLHYYWSSGQIFSSHVSPEDAPLLYGATLFIIYPYTARNWGLLYLTSLTSVTYSITYIPFGILYFLLMIETSHIVAIFYTLVFLSGIRTLLWKKPDVEPIDKHIIDEIIGSVKHKRKFKRN